MNKITRRFLSGVSFLALSVGLPSTEARAGITVNTAAHGPVNVAPFSVTDFILVTPPGIVHGDIFNDGFIINKATETVGINVAVGASVTDDIINAGFILAHEDGILVGGKVADNISVTANAVINVVNTSLGGDQIAGIEIAGGNVGGSIVNFGTMNVIATGQSGEADGILVTNAGGDVFTSIHNHGSILVVDAYNSAGANISVNAFGMVVNAGSDLQAQITNSGKLTETAVGAGKTVFASAVGISITNIGNTDGASENFAQITNKGAIQVVAAASGTAKATAQAAGIWVVLDGGGATTARATVQNTPAGNITVTANANGSGVGFASAFGINEAVTDATDFVNVRAFNSGVIHVLASGSGTKATAAAVGVQQVGIVGSSGTALAVFHNAGTLDIKAHASGSGHATASGLVQLVKGTATGAGNTVAHASVSNLGAISVLAEGFGDIASAAALGAKQTVTAGALGTARFYNAGDFSVLAKASGATSAHAAAQGLLQQVDPATGTALFTNTSAVSFKVTASAQAKTHASAVVFGINQTVTASQSALASIHNFGDITIFAQASAANTTAPATVAKATAFVFGIGQAVNANSPVSAGTAKANISNAASATINIGAHAFASGVFVATANAGIVYGIGQSVVAGGGTGEEGQAHARLTNAGDINIAASATAEAWLAGASAKIGVGVSQFASATSTAGVFIHNSGLVGITAHAIAHASTSATAVASVGAGIAQNVVTNGWDGGNATLQNLNDIDIKALATATASQNAVASALIGVAISQSVAGTSWDMEANVLNFGNISVVAQARATANSAYDVAKISSGLHQHVVGGNDATASLYNSGTFNVRASAVAHGQNQAFAWGTLNYGINQFASGTDSVQVTLANFGDIHLSAIAQATATNTAHAAADMVFGVFQSAVGSNAGASIFNNGNLDIVVGAKATGGGSASAIAHLSNWGIYQVAQNAWDAQVSLTNNGVMGISVDAYAKGNSPFASAQIGPTSGVGIGQYASAAVNATAALLNFNEIDVVAKASAIDTSGGGGATANAFINGTGIRQSAFGGTHAHAFMDNDDSINIEAFALASAKSGPANASAYITAGIHQLASAAGTTTANATAAIFNSGNINIWAKATALASGTVDANAFVATGINQGAFGSSAATASIFNSGVINIQAWAFAQGDAAAHAAIGTGGFGGEGSGGEGGSNFLALGGNSDVGIHQHASAVTAANVTYVNGGGVLNIIAKATAIDTQIGPATATAQVTPYGILQSATAKQASVKLTNRSSGGIQISAAAFASAISGAAWAKATVGTGISQNAWANTTAGFAKNAISNDGSLLIFARANAQGASSASAKAFITQGITQSAWSGATASNVLHNDGRLVIGAFAQASASTGNAVANASISDYVIEQNANTAVLLGSNKLTNGSGATLQLGARANAFGSTHAFAHVDVLGGISQSAWGAKTAVDLVSNHGNISISANAFASAQWAGGSASAYAYMVAGVYQYASGSENATAQLINSGVINVHVNATAHANATSGHGFAQATLGGWGIYQQATNAGQAQASIDNTGHIDIRVHAFASGSNATAFAGIGTSIGGSAAGIYQSASGTNAASAIANVTLKNGASGVISIVAAATAATANWAGATRADASAFIDSGIVQQALGAGNENINLTNSGFIFILADANANGSASADASADAFIYRGIYQHAAVSSGTAHISLSNASSGRIAIIADANAEAWHQGTASATISHGISQLAEFASNASLTIANNGLITVAARAEATWGNATTASAFAHIGTGIHQAAAVSGSTARAIISGSGHIFIEAGASATSADAFATAKADITHGISQLATGGSWAGEARLTQGTLTIVAHAQATAWGGSAAASANINTGIHQSATAGSFASAVINVGKGEIAANAFASADNANASASISQYGIYQNANGGWFASASFGVGSGLFLIDAFATAHASSGSAYASAYIAQGVFQTAVASSAAHANLTVGTGGNLDIVAKAVASGVTGASAWARNPIGISQNANSGTYVSATINNAGTISIAAVALANAFSGPAAARAHIDTGVHQSVNGVGTGTALASIVNSGNFAVIASAKATGVTTAFAYASISQQGIEQIATGGSANAAIIRNTGDLTIGAFAHAVGDVFASAYIGTGIYQSANGGVSATAQVTNGIGNNIKIIAQASATGGGATASASIGYYGIVEFARTASVAKALITNAGDITIMAHALANATTGTAIATAAIGFTGGGAGIHQLASGASTASAIIANSGKIAIEALATANGVSAATATAKMVTGVQQTAIGSQNAFVKLTGAGDVSIAAIAKASATSGAAVANATIDNGIYQTASVTNTGISALASIDIGGGGILALASAKGAVANANATITAYGIYQTAHGAGNDDAKIGIGQPFTIAAIAKADASTAGASAYATIGGTGVYQHAGTGFASFATASIAVHSAGALNIMAQASASGVTHAFAGATITGDGIHQQASSASWTANALIHNDGNINIAAIAKAVATSGGAVAFATIGTGIYQYAQGDGGTNAWAFASIDNGTGDINVVASAFASAVGNAFATAKLSSYGIYQNAANGGLVEALIHNDGDINIAALAKAISTSGTAVAHATLGGIVIVQSAVGIGGSSNQALASIDNGTGAINIVASAFASGAAGATATAKFSIYGISQNVYNAGHVSALIGNSGGDINWAALAKAVASSGSAVAHATLGNYGIFQYADALGGSTNQALASIDNGTGAINVVASAFASGAFGATASASLANYGIYQDVFGAGQVSALIGNSGDINVAALAKAIATTGGAVANATLNNYGIFQYADAIGTSSAQALASIDNGTGAINVVASAFASANWAGNATATASLANYGIYQDVFGAGQVSALIGNSGDINVAALAKAISTNSAFAHATIDVGVYQIAYANGTTGNQAVVSIANGGALNIVASAYASGSQGATASASISNYGIYQYAYNGDAVKAKIDSSGTLNVAALAKAVSTSAGAKAHATIGTAGIYQYAYALGNNGDQVTASITAGKALNVIASAHATGLTGATASATITDAGIYQYAYSGATVNAKIENSGGFNIAAIAYAKATSGAAYAYATMSYGIYQVIYANGTSGNNVHAAITNNGAMNIVASAHAVGAASVTASASISRMGIYQWAYNADTAKAAIENSGSLNIAALAKAVSTSGAAIAHATIHSGVFNYATANGNPGDQATASIDNGGDLNVIASAFASGTFAKANASITAIGIYQLAGTADTALAVIHNSGTLNIAALAHAIGDVTATAFINTGIYQSANGVVKATAQVTNTANAVINIIAQATATGGSANAFGTISGYGIYEQALSASNVLAVITNAGTINIVAGAKAIATTGAANAFAGIASAGLGSGTGIYQTAVAGNGQLSAEAKIANSGKIAIEAIATAHGQSSAQATAYMLWGISQYANNAEVAKAELTGAGTVALAAIASATAATGYASGYALIDTGIYQSAKANVGGRLTAVAAIDVANLAIIASAYGKGTSADAYAYINNSGIYQLATSADIADVSLKNSGVFNIAALASASATVGKATGYAYIDHGIYQSAQAADDRVSAIAAITNSGTMAIVASAVAKGISSAQATAYNYYGIYQYGEGGAIGSALLNGGGKVTVAALASAIAASGFASGYGYISTGIYQYATAFYNGQTKAVASISIDGGAIIAAANAKGTSASAFASLYYYGVEQQAYYGDQALVSLKNTGSVNIGAFADATATVKNAEGYAYVSHGIYQYASASDDRLTALAAITNSGTMNVIASGKAVGVTSAKAYGYNYYPIEQYAYGAGVDSALFVGGGDVALAALASASAAKGLAYADAFIYTGIYQYASAPYNSQTLAKASIALGDVAILAIANAKGTSASAIGSISNYGIYQSAYYGDQDLVTLKNDGDLTIAAIANASATAKSADAYAYLDYGIYQNANASSWYGGDQVSALAAITNNGAMNIIASAHAVGVTKATQDTAYLYYGIEQYAYYGGKANVEINGGQPLNIAAIASASAAKGPASAYAFMYTGIYQYAYASGSQTSANAFIDVGGGGVMAIANAKGTAASAYASISAYGIYQSANNADEVSVKLLNSGVFDVAAIANATGTSNAASAYGYLYTGIYQYADAANNSLTAIASIDNSGTLAVIASAHAAGATNAVASASITDYGIYQSAIGAGIAQAKIVGGGIVDVAAIANATASKGPASAHAFLSTGIYQYPHATGNSQTSAVASISVSGGGVMAIANAKGSTAQATASITNYGIYQYVSDADYVAANFKNTGGFNIAAIANATASVGFAFASATISTAGIYQYVYAGDDKLTAVANFTNSGTMAVIASAHAKGVTGASAIGYLDYGISQYVASGHDAGAHLVNDGDLMVGAGAVASAASGGAFASASLVTGIYQYVYGTAGSGAYAHASLTNTGQMIVFAQASAKGTAGAAVSALATISQYGIFQEAYYGDTAKVGIHNNSGTLAVEAIAHASGDALAHAQILTGIYQSAYATNNQVAATASITNGVNGVINVAAIATAVAALGGATASASITGYGIYEYAYSADVAKASIANAGALAVVVKAAATAVTGFASADAVLTSGIYQYASAAHNSISALAVIDNSGSLAVIAEATANGGSGASATATDDYGIQQYAFGAGIGKAQIGGGGAVTVAAIANASATSGFANALATMITGIYQSATANYGGQTNALASMDVAGGGVMAIANAKGTGATAEAHITTYGIYQHASGGDTDTASFNNNSGIFDIAAVANATAVKGFAEASATMHVGIFQSASAANNSIGAHDYFSNGGTFGVIAQANASGVTGASATATFAYGISQNAYHGGLDSVSLENTGSIDVLAAANAVAASGFAHATAMMITGIYQYVSAFYGSHTSALANLSNQGDIAVIAAANAKGTGASATAHITNYGIDQTAVYADFVSANIDNGGAITVAAVANATGTVAAASALASVVTGVYQYASGGNYTIDAVAHIANGAGGTLAVIASANASGETAAAATAVVTYGIAQYAVWAGDPTATLENSGELDIVARASAAAAKGAASASAILSTAILQSATAFHGGHSSAFVSLTNGGTMAIEAVAQAAGTVANATADIVLNGIHQVAIGGDSGTVSLANSGTLEIAAIAGASADNTAKAFAHIAVGIYQQVTASFADNVAQANISNATSGKLEVFAFASATGNPANATAHIDTGVLQSATGADADFAFIDNGGTMNIAAMAHASGDVTALAVVLNGVVQLASSTLNHGTAQATLLNGGKLFVTAFASAIDTGAGSAKATAVVGTHGVYQEALNGASDTALLENSGILGVNAIAKVSGANAFALAWILDGVGQLANGVTGGTAHATLTNDVSATLVVAAQASAIGGAKGTATAFVTPAVSQVVSGVQTGTAFLVNSGLLEAAASAHASGGSAIAQGVVIAASQNVVASSAAFATMINAGTFIVLAGATALGGAFGSASAFASGGLQIVSAPGTAVGSIVNSGTFEALAHASASANNAVAKAQAFGPQQTIVGGDAAAFAANTGTFIAQAVATALGGNTAVGSAFASGISQSVVGTAAFAEIDNANFYQVVANAKAVGDNATAFANALGAFQQPSAVGGGTAAFINSSVMVVHAKATATATAAGIASAWAGGVGQFLAQGGNATFHNAGTFLVSASANAFGKTASAFAYATGVGINGGTGVSLNVDVLNTGIFHVAATANDAFANATGVRITYSGTGVGGKIAGNITNDATMLVTAIAPGGTAHAVGIAAFGSTFVADIFNGGSGLLQVYAQGSSAAATAIKIGNGGATGAAGTGTITNDGGTIWAGIRADDTGPVLRGTAIDVSEAPNAIVINLEGNSNNDGEVFGNIKLSPNNDDTVNVINGKTIFDGAINPDGDLFGTLNVGGGTHAGTLEFVHNPVEGQAYAYVDTYNQFADGTIFFHVDPNPDPNFVFIHANDASLDGTILLDFAPGLYADTTVYRIVLATNPITGQWDQVLSNFQSLFLTPEARYTTFEADIVLNRNPFTDFCQTSKNNKSFTKGLENGYSPSLTGPFADMIKAILFLQNEDQFCEVVDQLKGEEIGQTAYADIESAEILKDAVSAHLQAVWGGPEQMSEMRSSIAPAGGGAHVSFWGGGYGKWGSVDRTQSGPGFDSNENGLVGGADLQVDGNTLLGVAGSWASNGDLDFDNNNDGSYEGYQIGVYGRHNAGALYLQALAAFGSYSNDTRRFVSIPNFGSGNIRGSFDSDVWQVYGEGGWHLSTGGRVDLVPYVALHYLNGQSDAYTEHGLPGANLHISSADATSFASYLGVKMTLLGEEMGENTSIVPTIKVAWKHEFEDALWDVDAAFDGVPATAFHLSGDDFDRETLAVGGELAISWGSNVDAVISYEGRFNGDRDSNAVIGRLNFRL